MPIFNESRRGNASGDFAGRKFDLADYIDDQDIFFGASLEDAGIVSPGPIPFAVLNSVDGAEDLAILTKPTEAPSIPQAAQSGSGVISLTSTGTAFTQDFNTLSNTAGSTTNTAIPTGWYFLESLGGARDNGQYAVDTGSSTTGDTYSYGSAASADRALGQLRSGTLLSVIGAQFTNNTGSTLGSLLISFFGEQWRFGGVHSTIADKMDFQISFDATSLSTGTWTDINALDFNAVITTGTAGALDGNAAANRVGLSTTLSGLNIANGASFWIRLVDVDASGGDDGLAIDDFSITGTAAAPSNGSLAINDVSLTEGDSGATNYTFTVTRSGGSSGAVGATWALANGTSDNADFTAFPQTGTVSFADGQTSATITITVAGDTSFEGNDTFFVNLTAPTGGATITDGQGQGTITNDDAAPVAQLAINDVTLAEGNSGTTNFTFTVTRSGDTSGTSSATWTVANGTTDAADFTGALTGTVSFAAGETSQTITVQVNGDTGVEANETFTVTLTNPSVNTVFTDDSGTGTITNDDVPPIANIWINEIHYDDVGADTGEAVEVAGLAGTDLTGWSLVFYNGNGGASYGTVNLSGTVGNQSNGYGTLQFAGPAGGIQNGAPDGIALVDNFGRVVQFLSYEGTMVATNGPANGMTSTDIGVAEEPAVADGFSLQLVGAGGSYADFSWTVNAISNTFGSPNTGQSFLSATDPGQIRVLDASVTEGNSGTTLLTFTVRRAGGTSLTSDVAYTINLDGTADAADLAPGAVLSGTVSFAVGQTERAITLAIQGDTVGEFNETLSVTLNSATNATITDGTAIGTIVNDDPLSLRIYDIQGQSHTSAYAGQNITTSGIVTAVDTDGYYVQDATGDGNVATSDAIFVFVGGTPVVSVGDSINVTGTVNEVRPGNNAANLTTTQLTQSGVVILTAGNALPAATLIGTGGRLPPTEHFDDDGFATYDPASDGADFWESLEGMRVTIDAPLVTSPTNSFGETFVVASGGAGATGVNSRGGITIAGNANNFDDYNPERIQIDDDSGLFAGFTPNYTQGDRLSNVTGIISYNFQNYELLVTEAVTVTTDVGALPEEITTLTGSDIRLSIAAYNVENLDPGDGKFGLLAADIVYNLLAPDIISLEEIQDADGAGTGTDLSGYVTAQGLIDAIAAIGGPNYVYIEVTPSAPNTTGGEPNGNIRNGFLYNADRVGYVAGSATAVPGAAFNGSRSPLSAQFTFNGETITAISVHSTSRGGSDPLFGANQPPANAGEAARIAQSTAIQAYVANILGTDPDAFVAVLGDFNAFYFEQSLELIEGSIMTNLHRTLAEEERYSYVFEGNAQAIDHILVTNNLYGTAQFDAVHLNSEQPSGPSRPTDHDPVLATLLLNTAAVAQAGSASGNEDTVISGTVTATDRNGDTLTYSLVTDATNGTVVVNSDGTYSYTPNANFNGTDSFTFRANDGSVNGAPATVTLTVNPVNDKPTGVTLDTNTVQENAANGTVVGTAVASDPENNTIRYKLVDDADGRFAIDLNTGVITVANGALIDYETATSYSIWVRVFDGNPGGSIKRELIINVTDVPEALVLKLDGDIVDNGIFADTSVDGYEAFDFSDADAFAAASWRSPMPGIMTINPPLDGGGFIV